MQFRNTVISPDRSEFQLKSALSGFRLQKKFQGGRREVRAGPTSLRPNRLPTPERLRAVSENSDQLAPVGVSTKISEPGCHTDLSSKQNQKQRTSGLRGWGKGRPQKGEGRGPARQSPANPGPPHAMSSPPSSTRPIDTQASRLIFMVGGRRGAGGVRKRIQVPPTP